MPSLKDTKKRISSVKNTQKITRAMKLVSSAKYARANRATNNAAPYEKYFRSMVDSILGDGVEISSPLLKPGNRLEGSAKALIFVVSPDRGLCGGLNSNLNKKNFAFIAELEAKGIEVELALCGKRAILFGKKTKNKVVLERERILEKPSFSEAQLAAEMLSSWFVEGRYQSIFVSYTEFNNALTQTPKVEALLPIQLDHRGSSENKKLTETHHEPILEPSRHELVNSVLLKKIAVRIFNILLNGAAAEHAARMTAMDSATNNADEVIRSLTLAYNRARQASITKELIEITSGAEAL